MVFAVLVVLLVVGLVVGYVAQITITTEVTGRLEPSQTREVRSLRSGLITDVLVVAGDTVEQGQMLARIDSMGLKSELVRLRSQYRSTKVEMERKQVADTLKEQELPISEQKARSALLRARAELRDKIAQYDVGASASIDTALASYTPGTHIALDRVYADLQSARAELEEIQLQRKRRRLNRYDERKLRLEMERLQKRIRLLEARRERLTVEAPSSGVILTDRPQELEGELVKEGGLLFVIAELERWEVNFYVGERKVSDIEVGDSLRVEVQAFRDETRDYVEGVIKSVSLEPIRPSYRRDQIRAGPGNPGGSSQGGSRYRVTASLNTEQLREVAAGKLKNGYSVKGQVTTESGRILSLLWDYLTSVEMQ
jgi:multidrug resistance efflux pump